MDNQEKTLDQYAQEYVVNKRNLLAEEKEFKENKDFHEKAGSLKEHWEMVKKLREEIKADLKAQKDRITKIKGDMKLQEEMISFKLRDQQLSFFTVENEGEFTLKDKLKYKKFRKKKKGFRF